MLTCKSWYFIVSLLTVSCAFFFFLTFVSKCMSPRWFLNSFTKRNSFLADLFLCLCRTLVMLQWQLVGVGFICCVIMISVLSSSCCCCCSAFLDHLGTSTYRPYTVISYSLFLTGLHIDVSAYLSLSHNVVPVLTESGTRSTSTKGFVFGFLKRQHYCNCCFH